MAKLELVGKFHEIGTPTDVGEKKTKVQSIVFLVFGYQNRVQGIERPDEPWKIDLVGETVNKLNLTSDVEGATARITVYIEGYSAETKEKKSFFGYKVNLGGFEIINPRA